MEVLADKRIWTIIDENVMLVIDKTELIAKQVEYLQIV